MATEQTYVFDGTEVRKTGRIAVKHLTATRTLGTKPRALSELVEIEPVDKYQEWKKWVREIDLYTVEQANGL